MISEVRKGKEVNTEGKAKAMSEILAEAACVEELVRFVHFAENKDLSKKELCGIVSRTVHMNGKSYLILTTLTEKDVSRYRENTVFDHI